MAAGEEIQMSGFVGLEGNAGGQLPPIFLMSHQERQMLAASGLSEVVPEDAPDDVDNLRTPEEVEFLLETKGLRATRLVLGGKRPDEALPPKHLRDATRAPKPQPPTKEVEVYDEETGQWVMKTVPLNLGERVVAYAKYAGARITDKERHAAIQDLRRDSKTHKSNRRRHH